MLDKNTPISEFMTANPLWADADLPIAEARDRMSSSKVRHLPILRDGKLVGIVSASDILVVDSLEPIDSATAPVEVAMTGNAVQIAATDTLDHALAEMEKARVNSIAVMKGDELVGIFTTADAAGLLRRALVG